MPQFKPTYGGGRYAYRNPKSAYGQDRGRDYGRDRGYDHGYGYDHGHGYDQAPAFDRYGPAYTGGGGFSYGDPFKAYGFDDYYGPRSVPRGHTYGGYRQSGYYDDMAVDYRQGGQRYDMGPYTAYQRGRPQEVTRGGRAMGPPQGRLVRSCSAGALMDIGCCDGGCEENVQVCGDCCDCDDGPGKRDCNPCEASRCGQQNYNIQRKVGWKEFEGAVSRSFDRAIREAVKEIKPAGPPPPQEKIMIVKPAAKPAPQPQIRVIQSGQTAGYGYKPQPVITQINRGGPQMIASQPANITTQMRGLSLRSQTVQLPSHQPIRTASYSQHVKLPSQPHISSQHVTLPAVQNHVHSVQPAMQQHVHSVQPAMQQQPVMQPVQQQFQQFPGAAVQQVQGQQPVFASAGRQQTSYTYAPSPAGGSSQSSYITRGQARLY